MRNRIWAIAIWLICLSGWATSCGGGRNVVEPPSPLPPDLALPWPDSLGQSSVLPRLTSADNHRINLTLTGEAYSAKTDNAVQDTFNHRLRLIAGPKKASGGIYGFADIVSESAPFRISVQLFGSLPAQYYLGIADYQQQAWRWTSINAPTGEDSYDVPQQWQAVSPGGVFYAAVVTWNNQAATLASVTLNRKVVYPAYGLCFGPYLNGLNPNRKDTVPPEQISSLLETVAPYCEWVRTHGATHGLEYVPAVAKSLGLSVAAACWLGDYPSDPGANESEIISVIALGQSGDVDIIIVGTEVLLRRDLTPDELIAIMQRVKAETGLPVTTNDTWYELMRNPDVMAECDVILANFYPFWEPYWHDGDGGVPIEKAMQSIHYNYQNLSRMAEGKEVIIGEVGWPSDGDPNGEAVPSPENAAFFWLNFASWAQAENVKYFYFEVYDEAWKANYEPCNVGDHWGVWDETGVLKPGMMKVFNGETIPDNWSYVSSGDPIIEFTPVPPYGSFDDLVGMTSGVNPLDYRVAVYIYVGGWWTKPTFAQPLTAIRWDGTWECDITTGGADETATEIAAYVVPNGYDPPPCNGDAALPAELDDNSVAHTEAVRSP